MSHSCLKPPVVLHSVHMEGNPNFPPWRETPCNLISSPTLSLVSHCFHHITFLLLSQHINMFPPRAFSSCTSPTWNACVPDLCVAGGFSSLTWLFRYYLLWETFLTILSTLDLACPTSHCSSSFLFEAFIMLSLSFTDLFSLLTVCLTLPWTQ